jgi:hypothetical protein
LILYHTDRRIKKSPQKIFKKIVAKLMFLRLSKYLLVNNKPMENKPQNNTIRYELDRDARHRMSVAKMGANNPNYGHPRDEVTKAKISKSQTERHAKIRAFNEISTMAATRRVWPITRYEGYCQYKLTDCHDVCAQYSVYDLKNDSPANFHRVYFRLSGVEAHRDFKNHEDAQEFMSSYRNPDIEFLMSEIKNNVVVLGILR